MSTNFTTWAKRGGFYVQSLVVALGHPVLRDTRASMHFVYQFHHLGIAPVGMKWRLESESNRRTRSCSPLHNHSATQPMKQSGMLLSFHTESLTKNGAGNRVRTGDLYLGKVPLYQLSYSRRCLHWRQIKWRPVGESNPCYRRERAVS